MLDYKWMNHSLYLLLFTALIIFLCTHTPNLELNIDPSYILAGPARPPLYPLFLHAFGWAGAYQYIIVMWLQGLFLTAALVYARNVLHNKLHIPDFFIFPVFVWVLVSICFHFQIYYIQSEGLAFPLFIFAFFFLLDCLESLQLKKICGLALVVSLLVLTRLQFYYFYGLFGLLCCWYLWQRIMLKKILLAACILFGSMGLTTVADHTYHYVKHGVYAGGSYSGLMVLVQALYLADDHASDYFQKPAEKNLMQALITQRNQQGLHEDASGVLTMKPSYLQLAYQAYARHYLALQNVIDSELNTSVEQTVTSDSLFKANAIATHFAQVLIQHEAKKNLIFLVWKWVECMGGVTLFLFFLTILLTLMSRFILNKDSIDQGTLFITIVTLITFCNAAIIALCNPDLPVYFCYSQFMFYCLAAFLVHQTFISYPLGRARRANE